MLKRLMVWIFMLAGLVTLSFASEENACKGDPNQWQQLFNGKDLNRLEARRPGQR